MLEIAETAKGLYEKLKSYESPEAPLFPSSTRPPGRCRNLQKILDLLETLPKISVVELRIERPNYSQFVALKSPTSSTFKRSAAEYLSQWGIGFEYEISISRSFYEALINYVDKHGLVNGQV